jgi:hypothetical protein
MEGCAGRHALIKVSPIVRNWPLGRSLGNTITVRENGTFLRQNNS